MNKAIVLQRLLEGHETLRPHRDALLAALVRGDGAAMREELEAAGISTDPPPD